MSCGTVNGKPLTDKENQEHQQQETTPWSQEQAVRGRRELEQRQEVEQWQLEGQEQVKDRAEALAH